MTRSEWLLKQLSEKMWVRPAAFCLLGLGTALGSTFIGRLLPDNIPYEIGAGAVGDILNILASSMLATTTFSLSVMVAAYTAAATGATPRATRLLLADQTAHNALGVFIGTFLYSLVGIIALKFGAYTDKSRFVLFITTIAVVAFIVVALLRWIDYLSLLGRVGQTLGMVEKKTAEAIYLHVRAPFFGGVARPPRDARDEEMSPVTHPDIGYVQNVDINGLQRIAKCLGGPVTLEARPGSFNDGFSPLVLLPRAPDEETLHDLRNCFSIGATRSFDQDPLYGMMVLSEISSRALSPGINDPGTAVEVINAQVRLLARLAAPDGEEDKKKTGKDSAPDVRVPALDPDLLFAAAFRPAARDGAGHIEISLRLLSACASLAGHDESLRPLSLRIADYVQAHAQQALQVEADRQEVKAAWQRLPATSAA